MPTLHYRDRPGDLLFPQDGRPQVRIRPLEDGTYAITNIAAGHTRTVPYRNQAVECAERIIRMLQAGSRR